MITINEGNQQKWSALFEDEDHALFVPGTIRYRLDDKPDDCGSGTEIVGWTTVAPQSSIEITIPSEANRILDSANPYERRILTIQSDHGTDKQLSHDEPYLIRNLFGIN